MSDGFRLGDKVRRRARAAAAAAALAAVAAFLLVSNEPGGGAASSVEAAAHSIRALADTAAGADSERATVGDKSDPLADIAVKMYIKGSGKGKYLDHSRVIADTWGKDLIDLTEGRSSLTFLMDNHNYDQVEEMGRTHPWATIKHLNGTDHQGEYRPKTGGNVNEAFRAQRIKMRAVFEDAFDDIQKDNDEEAEKKTIADDKFDWVCYMDDDMIVNVPNLFRELSEVRETCSPDCWIADKINFQGKLPYSAGGWCMERSVASRIQYLLQGKTDQALRWGGNDDVHFIWMLNLDIHGITKGLVPQNSERWYCHNSRPIEDEDGQIKKASMDKVPGSPWGDLKKYRRLEKDYQANHNFIDSWLPTVSVFHNRAGYDAYSVMMGRPH